MVTYVVYEVLNGTLLQRENFSELGVISLCFFRANFQIIKVGGDDFWKYLSVIENQLTYGEEPIFLNFPTHLGQVSKIVKLKNCAKGGTLRNSEHPAVLASI